MVVSSYHVQEWQVHWSCYAAAGASSSEAVAYDIRKVSCRVVKECGGSPSLLYRSIPASLCRKQVFGPGDSSVGDEKGKPKCVECEAQRCGRRVALLLL